MNRLIRRLHSGFGRDRPKADASLGLPCAVCGQPATGWAVHEADRDGTQFINGCVACPLHATEGEQVPDAEAG